MIVGRKEKRAVEVALWIVLAVALVGVVFAENQSGFSFLKIGVGARPIGLGSAYTAIANDATSLYWNPAGLASLHKKEFSAMHGEWLLGSTYDFLGMGVPSRIGTLGFGVSMLSYPDQQGRDEQGRLTSSFTPRSSAFNLALSRRVVVGTQLGLGVKLIQSQISSDKAQGVALDLGAIRYMNQAPVSIGFALQNIGPGIQFINEQTKLPLTAAGGVGVHVLGALTLAADIKHRIYDRKTTWAVGTEYSLIPSFSLRTGYALSSRLNSEALSGLGAGFGMRMMGYRLDYAITPFGELGNAHRVSLTARF